MNGNWSAVRWSAIPPARRVVMRRRFAALLAADLLAEPDPNPEPAAPARPRPLRFDALYEAASNPSVPVAARVADAIAADPLLRTEFEALLEAHAVGWFPVAAAAAAPGEAGLDRREADGFRIHIRPSAAGDGQVYVLIRVENDRDVKPATLVAMPADGPPLRIPLPEDIEGVYQLIEYEGSALVRAIRDPASKLALQPPSTPDSRQDTDDARHQ